MIGSLGIISPFQHRSSYMQEDPFSLGLRAASIYTETKWAQIGSEQYKFISMNVNCHTWIPFSRKYVPNCPTDWDKKSWPKLKNSCIMFEKNRKSEWYSQVNIYIQPVSVHLYDSALLSSKLRPYRGIVWRLGTSGYLGHGSVIIMVHINLECN